MEPSQFPDQFFGELDALRVDLEAALIDVAFAADHVQVATGDGGMEDGPFLVLDLLEAAEPALPADGFPLAIIAHVEEHTASGYGCQ